MSQRKVNMTRTKQSASDNKSNSNFYGSKYCQNCQKFFCFCKKSIKIHCSSEQTKWTKEMLLCKETLPDSN